MLVVFFRNSRCYESFNFTLMACDGGGSGAGGGDIGGG